MLEAVMIKQATKAGFIKWQVGGGGRSQLPNIKDQTRTRSDRRDRQPYDNVEQSGVVQVGAQRNGIIQNQKTNTARVLATYGIFG